MKIVKFAILHYRVIVRTTIDIVALIILHCRFVPSHRTATASSLDILIVCFIDNKSQFFAVGFNAGDFKNYDARKTSTNEKDKDDNDDEYLRNNTMS